MCGIVKGWFNDCLPGGHLIYCVPSRGEYQQVRQRALRGCTSASRVFATAILTGIHLRGLTTVLILESSRICEPVLCSQEPFGALLRYPVFHTAGEELGPPIVQINAVHIGPMGRPNETSNKVALQTEGTSVESYLAVLKFGSS